MHSNGGRGCILCVFRRNAFVSFAGMYILVTPQTVAGHLDSVRREQWAPALPTEERRGDRLVFVDGRTANDEPGALRRPGFHPMAAAGSDLGCRSLISRTAISALLTSKSWLQRCPTA